MSCDYHATRGHTCDAYAAPVMWCRSCWSRLASANNVTVVRKFPPPVPLTEDALRSETA